MLHPSSRSSVTEPRASPPPSRASRSARPLEMTGCPCAPGRVRGSARCRDYREFVKHIKTSTHFVLRYSHARLLHVSARPCKPICFHSRTDGHRRAGPLERGKGRHVGKVTPLILPSGRYIPRNLSIYSAYVFVSGYACGTTSLLMWRLDLMRSVPHPLQTLVQAPSVRALRHIIQQFIFYFNLISLAAKLGQ